MKVDVTKDSVITENNKGKGYTVQVRGVKRKSLHVNENFVLPFMIKENHQLLERLC